MPRGSRLAVVAFACLMPPASGLAQTATSTDGPRLVAVRTEPEEPSFGRAFDLRATLRIPPGFTAFLPDTLLPSAAIESLGPGRWTATPGPGDSVDIEAVYPVMGFRGGRSDLPALQTWMMADGASGGAAREAARSVRELGSDPSQGARFHLVRLGAVTVVPLLSADDSGATLEPRPAADVIGGVWNAWLLLAMALVAAAMIAGIRVLVWRRRSRGGPGLGGPHASPKDQALRELDRIRAEGWHKNGRIVEFYRSSTDALRRFAQQTEPSWGRALTSTEVLRRIEERWGWGGAESLVAAVTMAERVKFGGRRRDPDAAEADWEAIREWIEAVPEGD